MVTDVKLGESVGEVYRVTREEISVDTVQRIANLHTVKSMIDNEYSVHTTFVTEYHAPKM